METAPTQHMTLIVFGGALLAAIAVAVVIYLVPTINPLATSSQVQTDQTTPDGSVATQFNTSVLQSSGYKSLDASLFIRGLLPVQPPTGTGKTNLFR